MTINEELNAYYRNCVGHFPDNEADARATLCLIEYLKDCGFGDKIETILTECGPHDRVTPDMLPDSLWNGSLIKRNHFYYHHALQIISPAPRIRNGKEITTPFYREIKIRFTMNDLINYFYKTLNLDRILRNNTKDNMIFKKILFEFNRMKPIEPLDFTLSLIDFAKTSHAFIASPFDLTYGKAMAYTLDKFKKNIAQAKLAKADKVIWRTIP